MQVMVRGDGKSIHGTKRLMKKFSTHLMISSIRAPGGPAISPSTIPPPSSPKIVRGAFWIPRLTASSGEGIGLGFSTTSTLISFPSLNTYLEQRLRA